MSSVFSSRFSRNPPPPLPSLPLKSVTFLRSIAEALEATPLPVLPVLLGRVASGSTDHLATSSRERWSGRRQVVWSRCVTAPAVAPNDRDPCTWAPSPKVRMEPKLGVSAQREIHYDPLRCVGDVYTVYIYTSRAQ